MPTKTYYLDQESTESIIIKHGFNWKNLTITKDGELIGEVENVKSLKEGKSFECSGNRIVSIQLKSKLGFIQELEILLDGKPIPSSSTDPKQQLKQVNHLILFVAAFNAGLGTIAELANIEFLLTLGLGYGTIVVGLIYWLLAYLVKYKLSLTALYVAIGLMVLDIIFTLVFATEMGNNPTSGIMMKGVFTLVLFNGISAMKKVKEEYLVLEEGSSI